jgi:hypothetical protein
MGCGKLSAPPMESGDWQDRLENSDFSYDFEDEILRTIVMGPTSVVSGEIAEFEVHIKNVSLGSLVVGILPPSCGCTVVSRERLLNDESDQQSPIVNQGDWVTYRATVNTHGRRGTNQFYLGFSVKSNLRIKQYKVPLQLEIHPRLDVRPAAGKLSISEVNENQTLSFDLETNPSVMRITDISLELSHPTLLRAIIEPASDTRGRLKISLRPAEQSEYPREVFVSLRTPGQSLPHRIPVSIVNEVEQIHFLPRTVRLTKAEPEQKILLRTSIESHLNLLKADSTHPKITVSIIRRSAQIAIILVELTEPLNSEIQTSITLALDGFDTVHTIPVFYEVDQ